MTNATLASDNVLRFSKKLLEKIQKLIMKIDDKIRDEKLQYETEKKQKYHNYHQAKLIIGEEILPPGQKES